MFCLHFIKASGATAEQVWQDHLSDEASLRQYACSMHALATGPWREHGEGRIGWCVETIHQYFLDTSLEGGRGGGRGEEGGEGGGGQLRKLLLKDVTRQQHAMTPILEDALLPSSAEQAERTVQSFRGRKLRLLDVGSCYDPFAAYPDLLETTAIDISPAVEVRNATIASIISRLYLHCCVITDSIIKKTTGCKLATKLPLVYIHV